MTDKKTASRSFFGYFKIFFKLVSYKFLALPLLMLTSGLLDSFGIVLFLPLLDKLTSGGNGGSSPFIAFFYRILAFFHITELKDILIFIFLVFFVKFVVNFLQDLAVQQIMRKLYYTLSLKVIQGWEDSDYQKLYLETTTGYFTNILTSSIYTLIGAFKYYCLILVNVVSIVVYLATSLFLDVRVTTTAFVCGVLTMRFLRYFTKVTAKYSDKFAAENVVLGGRLVEFMQFYKYLKSTMQFSRVRSNLDASIKNITSYQFYMTMISNFLTMAVEPLSMLLVVILFYMQVVVWKQNPGAVMVLVLLFYRMLSSIIGLQLSWQKYVGCTGGVNLVLEALEKAQRCRETPGGKEARGFFGSLALERVGFSYDDKIILSDIGISVEKNRTIAIVGPSGAGKSTIVDLITGVLKPSSGRITIDGVDYDMLDKRSLRSMIGYIMQENVMFNDTIMNNITLWDPGASEEKAVEACRRAHCSHFIEKLPLRFQSRTGDRGINLSVGQRQRIALARELYRDTPILILDEATSALDTESENFIKKSIDSLKGSKTLVIIAHRLSTIKDADYVYVINDGKVKEHGSFEALFGNKESSFYKMCQLQTFF